MAYGLLASVPAVVGLYTSFWPVLVYFFLGTSKHNSMGKLDLSYILSPFAPIALLGIGIFKETETGFQLSTPPFCSLKKNYDQCQLALRIFLF